MKEFSPEAYRTLLAAFRTRGYTSASFADVDPAARHLVLRHDIDIWPDYAVKLAEIESELDWTADYFLLTTSEFYNPGSAATRAVIKKLIKGGHRIGLHFDASAYEPNDRLDAAAERESRLLEDITGTAVTIISFHRPAASLLGNDHPIAGRPHTYQSRFYREIGYCSDSRGRWDHGHPLQHDAVVNGRALQLLTHPIWWTDAGAPQDCLDQFLTASCLRLDNALAANVAVHAPGRMADLLRGS